MSFTIKVKEEIIAASSKDKAELSALIKMSGSVGLTNQGLTLSISTENAKIARHIYQLMESRYQSNPELRHHNKTNLKKNRVYTVFVADHVNDILSDLQLADSFFGFETGIETSVMEDDETGRTGIKLFRGGYPAVDQPDKNAGRSHGRKIRKGLHGNGSGRVGNSCRRCGNHHGSSG